MIRVELATEPVDFDSKVRQPGHQAIRELVGEAGGRRKPVASSREELRGQHFPPFWREALGDLCLAYQRICAYTSFYIEPVTGFSTTDHMLPKSDRWDRVYEWDNYRLACGRINARKRDAQDVLDPMNIGEHWFALEFVSYQVVEGLNLPPDLRSAAADTIERLGLNDSECRFYREELCREYFEKHISFEHLAKRSPFVAYELSIQGLAGSE